MPPLSSCSTSQTVTTTTYSDSTMNSSATENIEDPCDKANDEYIKSISDSSTSTTKEQEKVKIVWRNVILFALLHLASLYAVYLMFTAAKWQTNIFG